jgi:hypothetical protein
MSHYWAELEDHRVVEYQWILNGVRNSFSIKAAIEQSIIRENSEAEFITEHYWGYTKVNEKTTFEYGVTHPRWNIYEVLEYQINVDFATYGEQFSHLNKATPESVMLAEGSAITVENKRKL